MVLPDDVHMRRVVMETEDLVASFSGRETLDQFKIHLRKLILRTQQNENLHAYLHELKLFLICVRSEDEIRSEDFKTRSKELAQRGRLLFRELKEEDELEPFLRASEHMMENIKNDEFMQLLRHHAGIVQSDLSYVDSEGKIQVDTDMLGKLQTVLLPVLADALKYIPVPRIYSSDAYREFWLDKIVLCSYDIIPENIKFKLETTSEISVRDIQLKGTHTHLVIELDRLLTELKDVEFYYKKKTFPELEDSGRVTFRVKGAGAKLTIMYNVDQGPDDPAPKIKEGKAIFDISDMDIEFDTTTLQHPVLMPMLTAIFKLQIKLQIEQQVESNLTGFIQQLGELMSTSIAQANRPFLVGLEAARKAVKSSQIGQIYEKRREKLIE
jgi:hypothetical protein